MRPNESKRDYHNRRLQSLKAMRSPWEDHWQNLASFIAPTRLRLVTDRAEGKPDRKKIIDSAAGMSLRTLASGMHSGITSPARPWFRLATFDPEMRDHAPIKAYMSDVETILREVFQASNIYPSFHYSYGDLGLFGQSAGLLVEDDEKIVRMIQLAHGSFWLARDGNGMATTLYRQFYWTVEQIVGRFGLARVSNAIKTAYDRGNYDQRFLINHAVEPRKDREPGKIDRKNKPFLSNYWEDGGRSAADDSGLLEENGFDSNPIVAPPWELIAEDHYATGPGTDALPDVRMLQTMQIRYGEAVEKKVRPPMQGPTSLKNNPASLMPGSITYVDDVGGIGYRPAMEVNLQLNELENKIQQTQQRIDRQFYADLFLMLANMDGIQPRNQFEIAERKEEKLLALGPVLENIYGGQLAPVIDRTFEIANKLGRLPAPPPELEDKELKIEYISMLAQAQKAVATGSIERLVSFAGNLAAVKPDILDKLDLDESIDLYADMLGAPPSIVVPDEAVKTQRDGRAQRQAQAEQAAQAAAMAPAAKQGAEAARLLSETDANGQNLLQQMGIA